MGSKPSAATSKSPRLRVGLKGFGRAGLSAAVNERSAKQRVSIMPEGSITAFLKATAGERGYRTLINQAPGPAIAAFFFVLDAAGWRYGVSLDRSDARAYLGPMIHAG